ncbi:MAG: helix-turn-helix transcriptional regulator [Verrucomicrobiota bacterium]
MTQDSLAPDSKNNLQAKSILMGGSGAYPMPEFHFDPKTLKGIERLKPREKAVLAWIAKGKTNPEIAELLHFSVKTVERDCYRIFAALEVENRFAAASLFLIWMLRSNCPDF